MYLRHLHVKNVKLLRDVPIDFTTADGQPRMWTVFVGENRLCKTTLLQTIAAAASGVDRGTQLVARDVASWPDLRDPVPLSIEAEFGFSERRHGGRMYPGTVPGLAHPPRLSSTLTLDPKKRVFGGGSRWIDMGSMVTDPLTEARGDSRPDWFVAGYGPSRLLPRSGGSPSVRDPVVDRLAPLFGGDLIGTGFVDLLGEDLGRAFAGVLKSVFVTGGLLPHIEDLELRGRGGIRSTEDLVEAQRFETDTRKADGTLMRVPAVWLSQGYQSLIAWLADVVGYVLLEGGVSVQADQMEGVVLVDEIDLHLHPTWQVGLVRALRHVFPRLQFIATTHSPMVLPGLAAEEVFILSQDEAGSVRATQATRSPELLTGTELLDAFFEIRKLHPGPLGDKLRRYADLATDPTRSDDDDACMHVLRKELVSAGIELDWEPVAREQAEQP